MRRTVATLLVVATPLLLATPVSASEDHLSADRVHSAVAPAAPAPLKAVTPAVPGPAATLSTPALPAPAVAPEITTPPVPTPVRHARPDHRTVRAKAPTSAADLSDAAYAARLQAELCQARAIFCGLDRNGRYPAS